jgi:hypothetical protein
MPLSTRAPASRDARARARSRARPVVVTIWYEDYARCSPPGARLSSLLTLRTLVSVPSTCAYPQRRQLSARVVLGLGRKRARTHARATLLPLSAVWAPDLRVHSAGGARLVSPPQRSSSKSTQPRAHAHSPTRFSRRARASSRLSTSPIFCRRDLGRRQGCAARRAFHVLTNGATALPPLDVARAHLRPLPRPRPRQCDDTHNSPHPWGRKKGSSGQRVREGSEEEPLTVGCPAGGPVRASARTTCSVLVANH